MARQNQPLSSGPVQTAHLAVSCEDVRLWCRLLDMARADFEANKTDRQEMKKGHPPGVTDGQRPGKQSTTHSSVEPATKQLCKEVAG